MLTGLTRNLSSHNDKKTQRQNRKAPLDHCISKDPRPQYLKTGLIYAEEGFIISREFNQAEDEPLNVIFFTVYIPLEVISNPPGKGLLESVNIISPDT